MTEQAQHPIVKALDSLVDVRESLSEYARSNPNDVGGRFAGYCAANFMGSQAQLFQDLLVVFFLKGRRNGFFVEFGATDGVGLNNTLVLERNFQWTGILAEPAACFHAALKANRKAAIDTRCVWSASGERLDFVETQIPELSTVSTLAGNDQHKEARSRNTRTYAVETVSLNDLLAAHDAPREIDYLSVDTEGSEPAILKAFDFSRYDVKIATVEHNYIEPNRGEVHALMTANGFLRLMEPISKFDDWYIKRAVLGL